LFDDQGPPPTLQRKKKRKSTDRREERPQRKEKPSWFLYDSTVPVVVSPLSLSLSLSLPECRRSFLTDSSFGQDLIFWSHSDLWFADLRGVFAVAALAVL
jgi:hypothetical protein